MQSYFYTAASLAQEATRISQQLTSNIVEKTREVGVLGHLYDHCEERMEIIPKQLDSSFDKDKIDALKRLLALVSKGHNVQQYFAQVIKNVNSNSFPVRKLVYIYILRYCDKEPDLSLLSINTFQKDLADRNPIIRHMALRVLSGIKLQMTVPIVLMGIRKAKADFSPYVRKTACNCLTKVLELDPQQKPTIIELLELFLNDTAATVLATACGTFNKICPDRFDLIHPHYRKLCKRLSEADEWGQLEILKLLTNYCRKHFVDPQKMVDLDHQLFLDATSDLLMSGNPSTALNACLSLYYCGKHRSEIGQTLMRLYSVLGDDPCLLSIFHSLCLEDPQLIQPCYKRFIIRDDDPVEKLEILESMASNDNIHWIVKELQHYCTSPNTTFGVRSLHTYGILATKFPQVSTEALLFLMRLTKKQHPLLVGEAIIIIRRLLAQSQASVKDSHAPLVIFLLESWTEIHVPMAKASIIWLMCHHLEELVEYAPDCLRLGALHFVDQDPIVKLYILNLGLLLKNHQPDPYVEKVFEYLLELGQYDRSMDVRDRTRLIRGLCKIDKQLAKSCLMGTHQAPSLIAPASRIEFDHRFWVPVGIAVTLCQGACGWIP
ncbi:Clathrin/coatomer adaptor, adaptin-like protein [Gorgonomyces haynaldii]|nr:Clathrin/coatomer adaptor, adaptin-like protein [Gorgonomyces haynaldii]